MLLYLQTILYYAFKITPILLKEHPNILYYSVKYLLVKFCKNSQFRFNYILVNKSTKMMAVKIHMFSVLRVPCYDIYVALQCRNTQRASSLEAPFK
jgi:hypothetical protein